MSARQDRPGDGSALITDERETTRIAVGDAILEAFVVPWDSTAFGFPVAEVSRFELPEGQSGVAALQGLDAWCADRGVRFVSCRLDHARLRESMALEERGFRFVETVYMPRFEFGPTAELAEPGQPIEIERAGEEHLPAVERLAREAFTTGRFLLDWRLDRDVSGRRYAAWVRSAFGGSQQVVLLARAAGALVGFFIVERRPDSSVYWHLTAIAPASQGRGLGRAVWETMLRRHRDEGATLVETTISGHNLATLNLYARLGFSFGDARMTFHWLREPAG